jgi:MarR family transcriptional regulator for hemolysin
MEGCRQAELAESLDVRPITLARLIDRLQAAGLVERRPRKDDRRAVQLMLTPKAKPIVKRMWALGAETRERAFAGLGERERTALFAALGRVRDNLSSAGGSAARKEASRGR